MQDTPFPVVKVIIPAFNEERSIGKVLADLPKAWVAEVVVVSNNSTDNTAEEARKGGATVLQEARRGYGYACLKGMEYLASLPQLPDIVAFLDGDYSDYPEELPQLVRPIVEEGYDFIVGSRALGRRQKGAMLPQQVAGNWVASRMMRLFYGIRSTDLGPFRAIRYEHLMALQMEDKTFGWTVEMQLKAARKGYRFKEVPVSYRPRIGDSKVSGNLQGALGAGYKILGKILTYAFRK